MLWPPTFELTEHDDRTFIVALGISPPPRHDTNVRLGWRALRSTAGPTTDQWFIWGQPAVVVVRLDDHAMLIAASGPDVTRFEPNKATWSRRVPRSDLTWPLLATLTDHAAAAERSARTWCLVCGQYQARQPGPGICPTCHLAVTETYV